MASNTGAGCPLVFIIPLGICCPNPALNPEATPISAASQGSVTQRFSDPMAQHRDKISLLRVPVMLAGLCQGVHLVSASSEAFVNSISQC